MQYFAKFCKKFLQFFIKNCNEFIKLCRTMQLSKKLKFQTKNRSLDTCAKTKYYFISDTKKNHVAQFVFYNLKLYLNMNFCFWHQNIDLYSNQTECIAIKYMWSIKMYVRNTFWLLEFKDTSLVLLETMKMNLLHILNKIWNKTLQNLFDFCNKI